MVAYLGRLDEEGRLGVHQAAVPDGRHKDPQRRLAFSDDEILSKSDDAATRSRWVTVNTSAVRVENCVQFGGPWLALELIKKIGLDKFLDQHVSANRADVSWSSMALVLIICRLCKPSSELSIAEHFYRESALSQLLGVPEAKIYHTRLYRALDQLCFVVSFSNIADAARSLRSS